MKKAIFLFFAFGVSTASAQEATTGPATFAHSMETGTDNNPRQRISINKGWSFYKYDSRAQADRLIPKPSIKSPSKYQAPERS